MSDAKRRLDRRNAQRSQAMAREAAQVLADEKVRLEGVALTRPNKRRIDAMTHDQSYPEHESAAASAVLAEAYKMIGLELTVPQARRLARAALSSDGSGSPTEDQIHDVIAAAFAREGLTYSSVRRAAKAVLALSSQKRESPE